MSKSNFNGRFAVALGCAALLASAAHAENFNVPAGDLKVALDAYARQSGIAVLFSSQSIRGVQTKGVKGDLSATSALTRILAGTGLATYHDPDGSVGISKQNSADETIVPAVRLAAATATSAGIESVVVTSSKIKGDIQTVPIAITALSQEQLTSRQIAGGPDLVKEVPNLTFSKTNFSGYNIQIRGIGTQAISVTTDPAVAVALNDIPFIRNHFFEQEFYDLSQAEVLRGPQGTLYGRNATAGVVNIVSAKPTDQFEAMLSADWGNYQNRRYEGMVNIPIVDDRADLRIAGEWTKRDGYSFNSLTNAPIDGRDLWSSRVTLGFKPTAEIQSYLVWEHFQEDDDRIRSGKQLCKTAPIPTDIDGANPFDRGGAGEYFDPSDYLSQGCLPASLYSADAFEVPNGYALTYYAPLHVAGVPIQNDFNVYATTTQSHNLRVIESALNPVYKAKNDTLEWNTDYQIASGLTVTAQTGYNQDFLWSSEDYDRFNSAPGAFVYDPGDFTAQKGIVLPDPAAGTNGVPANAGVFCDPQLGCSDRLVLEDLSDERAWQLSQEIRLASNFSGPLNFSIGGNYLHYETEENYYVFLNSLTLFALSANGHYGPDYVPGVSDNHQCLIGGLKTTNPTTPKGILLGCDFVDPNPLSSLDNEGHNYFLSQNPYVLNSYAGFGEAYYNFTNALKLTAGLRWTDDQKHFVDIPSELVIPGYGYGSLGAVNQQLNQLTGRAAVDWTPKLDFTNQTLIYGSYAHGYKAGGANPPGAFFPSILPPSVSQGTGFVGNPVHPLTFKPEFVDAYELGTKNTLFDGGLTLNGDVFYYNYKSYQISEIVDRTAINLNFNATIRGAEVESTWEPVAGLKFSFAGGYEDATLNKGDQAVDLMDRAAGMPGWIVVKPFVTEASNCVLPDYVVAAAIQILVPFFNACNYAYNAGFDPVTGAPYSSSTDITLPNGQVYHGFDPADPSATNNGAGPALNNGEGFDKNLGGNQLPNAPHFTTSLSADYTMPVSEDWAATVHSDFYWQSQSFARVFNDRPYDKLRGYSNVNLALILTSASGWQVMGYLKNVFNVTAITGDFLNSDDTGLTTNVFLTDPRLYGVRITKNW